MIADSRPKGDGDDVPPDMIVALQHTLRREVVEQLCEHGGDLSLVTLANEVADETNKKLPDVLVELHDLHLSELTGCDLIEYDSDTGIVTLTADSDVVEAVLDRVRSENSVPDDR